MIVVAFAVLAGCLQGPDAGQDPTPASEPREPSDPPVLPDNRPGDFAAFKETNVSDAAGDHSHDYWGGRSRVEIARDVAEMGHADGVEGVETTFRLPTGPQHIVYEGTAAVEVTISSPQRRVCTPGDRLDAAPVCSSAQPDPVPPTELTLSFLHATSEPDGWIDAGAVAWDEPKLLAVEDPAWADMPHSAGSLWAFRVSSPNPQEAGLVFTIAVTIVRMDGEIPEWPGHPVFYAPGNHYRVVYEGTGESGESLDGGLQTQASPAKLISAGTRSLLVFANLTGGESTVEPTHFYLYYHNASGRNWLYTEPFDGSVTGHGDTLAWRIPVDDNGMDTPYATQSRWEFVVRGAYSTPAGSCLRGCLVSHMETYDLTVIATDLVVDGYAVVRIGPPR